MDIIHRKLCYAMYGICYRIQNSFGRALKEKQYGDLLAIGLKDQLIPFRREILIAIAFAGNKINGNFADFLINNQLILEIKAKQAIGREDYWQLKRYLTAANLKLGLLINFRAAKIKPIRVINRTGLLALDSH